MLEKKPSLIMFDLDGTLADTVPQLHNAVIYALKLHNKKEVSIDQTRDYVGNGPDLLMARALTQNNDATLDDVPSSLLKSARLSFNEYYSNHYDCCNSLFENVRETLEYIKSQNIKLAIVTNKPHKFVEPIIRMAGLYDLFDYLLGSEVITQKKPQPEPLLYVCNKLAILPEDAIMVGDSYNDIEAAKNANIISIALTYGYNRGRDIRDSKPDFVFSDFGQIAELIKTVA